MDIRDRDKHQQTEERDIPENPEGSSSEVGIFYQSDIFSSTESDCNLISKCF